MHYGVHFRNSTERKNSTEMKNEILEAALRDAPEGTALGVLLKSGADHGQPVEMVIRKGCPVGTVSPRTYLEPTDKPHRFAGKLDPWYSVEEIKILA